MRTIASKVVSDFRQRSQSAKQRMGEGLTPVRSRYREKPVPTHTVIDPAILHFGTPVVLLSTVDSAGKTNTAPMSSVFWLGQTALIGMGARSLTAQNLLETGECVLNLPTVDLVDAVDKIALTTGRNPVPSGKAAVGYRYEAEKITRSGLHSRTGDTVRAERIIECPVNLEARVVHSRPLEKDDTSRSVLREPRTVSIRISGAR